jgi:hypothetical protein
LTVLSDSAQFSALVTVVGPPQGVGTALNLLSSLGFAVTLGSIRLASEIARGAGWGPAFSILAVGPALGIVAMARLAARRRGEARASAG